MNDTDQLKKTPNSSQDLLPLTDAQAGIWYAQQRDPDNPIYKTGEYIVIDGMVDESCFVEAVTIAVNEVDSLHARFMTTIEGPRMLITRRDWEVDRLDFSKQNQPLECAIDWMKNELSVAVDLAKDRLFSMAFITLSPKRCIWFLSLHHIAIDGYSMSLIASRVAHIYTNLTTGTPVDSIHFASQQTILDEDNAYKLSDRYVKDRNFYLERYKDHSDTVNLAGKPTVTSDRFLRLKGVMERSHFTHMEHLAKQCRTHWYSVLMASIASYVHRMTGSKEVVLGMPLMGRLGSVAIQTPSMRVNILPVRVSFGQGISVVELVKQVNHEFSRVRRHQGFRYEELHRELNLVKDNRNLFGPLVNIMPFDYQHKFGDLSSNAFNLSAGPVDDISFYCYELDEQLHIDMDANPALYSIDDLNNHQQRLFHFMGGFFDSYQNSDSLISQLEILLPGEKNRIINDWNDTHQDIPKTTLTELLALQRVRTPTAPAIIFDETVLTYEQVAQKVEGLANWLRIQGVVKGKRVAVCVPRSIELIVVQQAVLAVGAVYVPIDPDYPDERIRYLLESSQPDWVFTHSAQQDKLSTFPHVQLVDNGALEALYDTRIDLNEDEIAAVELDPDDPAYIIYTSGSTGKPKGVVISHGAIVNRLLWMQDSYPIDENDRVLQKTPAGFDVSVWEFFWPMIQGSCLVVAKPEGHKDPLYLQDLIHSQKITTLHFVPSMLQVFVHQVNPEKCRSIKQVFCSGEALSSELVHRYLQSFSGCLHNLYGPTEAAIDVTYWPCTKTNCEHSVPIGFPVWNTKMYILDDELQPVPPGVVGHLYIAGSQLATGYFGQKTLTDERFIQNPFEARDSKMYRSGDLAFWRKDGAIEYSGRSDFQVKIRGFRIELEEIERALIQHPSVGQVAVLAPEFMDGDKRLVAYVVCVGQESFELAHMQSHLAKTLPEYMLPNYLVVLDAFPLTDNGKFDRSALPKPDLAEQIGTKGPSTLVEERLCKLFCKLLDLPEVGVDDNFFELGGHSLLAAQLIAYIREIMGVDLSLAAVFEAPTVASIAAKLDGSTSDEALDVLLPLRTREGQPAIFCVHPAGGLSWCYAALTPIIPSHIPLYGVQSKNLGNPDNPLPKTMVEMAEDYVAAIRKEQPFGPYHLLGWSIGGMIAHVMAAILQQQGQKVGLLTLLDSYPSEQWQTMNPPGEEQALGALIRMAGVEFDETIHTSLTKQEVIDILQDAGSSMAHLSAETIASMIEVVINNNHRVRDKLDYVYKGDMLFFNAEKSDDEGFLEKAGWNSYMDGDIKVVDVNCIHRDMMRPDMLRLIGTKMVEELQDQNYG